MGSWSVEAVLDHVRAFEFVLSEDALEDMLDDLVISYTNGLERSCLHLGGKLS